MTWGKLRFQLLNGAGDKKPSLDLLDEWLVSRYEQVLEAGDWIGIRARTSLETIAAYQSPATGASPDDTVTLTAGSTAVVGLATSFTSDIVGMRFFRPGDVAVYTIAGYTSSTLITLDRPYEGDDADPVGTVYSACPYSYMQDIYSLPGDCKAVTSIIDAVTGYPLTPFTQAELDMTAGPRTTIDDPQSYAEIEDTSENAGPPVLHQIQFYPAPRSALGYTLEYLRNANTFDGTNINDSPLPFVSQSVLLYGVRADIAIWQGKMPAAAAFEALFSKELNRLLMVEHAQRRSKPTMRMAARFIRHRLERASRGFNNAWGPGAGGPN